MVTSLVSVKETTPRSSHANLVTTLTHSDKCRCTSALVWRTSFLLQISPKLKHLQFYQPLPQNLIKSIGFRQADSPWVFNEQRLDEINSLRGNPLKCVLWVVYVDLRDVEKCLLLVIAQEGRLAGQHNVDQDPDAPVKEEGGGVWELPETLRFTSIVFIQIKPGLLILSSALTTCLLQCWWAHSWGSQVLESKHKAHVRHDPWKPEWGLSWLTHPHTRVCPGSPWLRWFCPCVGTSQSPQFECLPKVWRWSTRCSGAGDGRD